MNRNQHYRTTSVARKLYRILSILGLLVLLLGIPPSKATSNVNQNAGVNQTMGNKTGAPQGIKLTAWEIILMNDWFLWPFIVVTAAGIMIVVYRGLCERREKSQSQALLQAKIRSNGIRNYVQMVKASRPNRASRLLYQLIVTFDKTNQAEPLGDDINQYLASEKENFEVFNRTNGFLSESAGALGLLGTVWGIFVTFWSGKMDGPTILQGMSIALVTTITGLIISLVLNSAGIYLYSQFTRQLSQVANKAEELRQVLLVLEKRNINNTPQEKEDIQKIHVADRELKSEKQAYPKMSHEIAFADI